jgi:hypothetical protein
MCPTGEQADSGGRQGWQHYSFFCGDAQSRVSHKLGLYLFFFLICEQHNELFVNPLRYGGGGDYGPPPFFKGQIVKNNLMC